MKKILFTICLTFILLFSSCENEVNCSQKIKVANEDESMFKIVEENLQSNFKIAYHKKTKVMYAISDGSYNRGSFVLLVNQDGTPMIWEGDEFYD